MNVGVGVLGGKGGGGCVKERGTADSMQSVVIPLWGKMDISLVAQHACCHTKQTVCLTTHHCISP